MSMSAPLKNLQNAIHYYIFFTSHSLLKALTFFNPPKLLSPWSQKVSLLNSRNILKILNSFFSALFVIIDHNLHLKLSDTFLHFLDFSLLYGPFFHCQERKSEKSCVYKEERVVNSFTSCSCSSNTRIETSRFLRVWSHAPH